MSREVPTLFISTMKFIAKQPQICINEEKVARALAICPPHLHGKITQTIIDYVTEAGRYSDGVIPPSLFDSKSKCLDVKNAKVSGTYLKQIFDRCSSLETVIISGCFQADDDVVAYLLNKCRNIKELHIQNCRKITDKSLQDIVSSGLKIHTLDIGGNFNITESGIINFLRTYRFVSTLKEINLSGLEATHYVFQTIVEMCRSLECVDIAYAPVTEESVRFLLRSIGSKLRRLNIAWLPCGDVGDNFSFEFFEILALSCPLLIYLDLCGIKSVTALNIQRYLDIKIQMSEQSDSTKTIEHLRVKFVASPKPQLETVLSQYANLKYEL